jgi:hypothetical protein
MYTACAPPLACTLSGWPNNDIMHPAQHARSIQHRHRQSKTATNEIMYKAQARSSSVKLNICPRCHADDSHSCRLAPVAISPVRAGALRGARPHTAARSTAARTRLRHCAPRRVSPKRRATTTPTASKRGRSATSGACLVALCLAERWRMLCAGCAWRRKRQCQHAHAHARADAAPASRACSQRRPQA